MKNIYAERGTKVKFIGATDEQVRWGSNDDPRHFMIEGEIYTVFDTIVHTWHTKVTLLEFPKMRFNSVHFEEAED